MDGQPRWAAVTSPGHLVPFPRTRRPLASGWAWAAGGQKQATLGMSATLAMARLCQGPVLIPKLAPASPFPFVLKGLSGRLRRVTRRGPWGAPPTWRQGRASSGFSWEHAPLACVIILSKGRAPSPSAVPLHNGSPSPSLRHCLVAVETPGREGNPMPVSTWGLGLGLQRGLPGNVSAGTPLGPQGPFLDWLASHWPL